MGPMEDFVRQTHDELITVRVGSGEGLRDFKLPKALLCARVAWFDSALRDERFLEGNTGIITLPEDDPGIFVAVHYYIYNQTLSFPQISRDDENSMRAEHISYCIRIWIFGHKYCMVGLQNCAMQKTCSLLKEDEEEPLLDNATLKACFAYTVPGSPLRTLAIDYIVDRTVAMGVQTIGDFNDVFACSDGATMEELFDAEEDRDRKEYDFPRYQSPLRHKDEMYVKDAGISGQADWNKDIILGTKRGSCADCGIFDGSSCVGEERGDKYPAKYEMGTIDHADGGSSAHPASSMSIFEVTIMSPPPRGTKTIDEYYALACALTEVLHSEVLQSSLE
ncbi:hypothetical protein LTS10_010262 [Elasticomyces elasticus]|nr:hypothetical protein LTS10_010262 [Elasticomyces elasticus]